MKRIRLTKKRKRLAVRHRPINVLASALTLAGLYCGIAATFEAVDEQYKNAAYFILAALVFDTLDGTVAKLTNTTSEFGKQLDSLCDIVSFGAAPAVLIYTAYLYEEHVSGTVIGTYGAIMAIIYVLAGALRLARYNVYQAERRDYFSGLPIPAAAVTVATFVLFTEYLELTVAFWVLGPLTLGLAYLMVSTFLYPKDKMKVLVMEPKNAFRILFIGAFAIATFHILAKDYSPAIILFPCALAYALFGPTAYFVSRMRKRHPNMGHLTLLSHPHVEESGEGEDESLKTRDAR